MGRQTGTIAPESIAACRPPGARLGCVAGLSVVVGLLTAATAGEAKTEDAGQSDSYKAHEHEDTECAEQHGDEQKQGRGSGPEYGIDDAEEDADESQGASAGRPVWASVGSDIFRRT